MEERWRQIRKTVRFETIILIVESFRGNVSDLFSLMEKMGWESGKGLGRNLHGDQNNIKLNANHTGKGTFIVKTNITSIKSDR